LAGGRDPAEADGTWGSQINGPRRVPWLAKRVAIKKADGTSVTGRRALGYVC